MKNSGQALSLCWLLLLMSESPDKCTNERCHHVIRRIVVSKVLTLLQTLKCRKSCCTCLFRTKHVLWEPINQDLCKSILLGNFEYCENWRLRNLLTFHFNMLVYSIWILFDRAQWVGSHSIFNMDAIWNMKWKTKTRALDSEFCPLFEWHITKVHAHVF